MGRVIAVEVIGLIALICVLVGLAFAVAAVFARLFEPRRRRSRGESLIRRNRARFQRERLRRARRTTPWVHYCRPTVDSMEYEIGIERVWNGHVLNRKQFPAVPEDDVEQRLELEGQAIAMAQEHNTSRVGMENG